LTSNRPPLEGSSVRLAMFWIWDLSSSSAKLAARGV
jgi:hypothetical protein